MTRRDLPTIRQNVIREHVFYGSLLGVRFTEHAQSASVV